MSEIKILPRVYYLLLGFAFCYFMRLRSPIKIPFIFFIFIGLLVGLYYLDHTKRI